MKITSYAWMMFYVLAWLVMQGMQGCTLLDDPSEFYRDPHCPHHSEYSIEEEACLCDPLFTMTEDGECVCEAPGVFNAKEDLCTCPKPAIEDESHLCVCPSYLQFNEALGSCECRDPLATLEKNNGEYSCKCPGLLEYNVESGLCECPDPLDNFATKVVFPKEKEDDLPICGVLVDLNDRLGDTSSYLVDGRFQTFSIGGEDYRMIAVLMIKNGNLYLEVYRILFDTEDLSYKDVKTLEEPFFERYTGQVNLINLETLEGVSKYNTDTHVGLDLIENNGKYYVIVVLPNSTVKSVEIDHQNKQLSDAKDVLKNEDWKLVTFLRATTWYNSVDNEWIMIFYGNQEYTAPPYFAWIYGWATFERSGDQLALIYQQTVPIQLPQMEANVFPFLYLKEFSQAFQSNQPNPPSWSIGGSVFGMKIIGTVLDPRNVDPSNYRYSSSHTVLYHFNYVDDHVEADLLPSLEEDPSFHKEQVQEAAVGSMRELYGDALGENLFAEDVALFHTTTASIDSQDLAFTSPLYFGCMIDGKFESCPDSIEEQEGEEGEVNEGEIERFWLAYSPVLFSVWKQTGLGFTKLYTQEISNDAQSDLVVANLQSIPAKEIELSITTKIFAAIVLERNDNAYIQNLEIRHAEEGTFTLLGRTALQKSMNAPPPKSPPLIIHKHLILAGEYSTLHPFLLVPWLEATQE